MQFNPFSFLFLHEVKINVFNNELNELKLKILSSD